MKIYLQENNSSKSKQKISPSHKNKAHKQILVGVFYIDFKFKHIVQIFN